MSEYKLSKSEAIDYLKSVGEDLEVDTESEEFLDAIKALMVPVRKENLVYNGEDKAFELVLFFPIEKVDGSGSISKLKISAVEMKEKKKIQDYKDSQRVDQSIAMLAESCGINLGFAARLKEKDVGRINAIVTVFLA